MTTRTRRDPLAEPRAFTSKRKDGKSLSSTVTDLGYPMDEVRSALQKTIRRGEERQACWWAYQLIQHGWVKYLWSTLRIVASEDVGVAAPEVAVQINALATNAEKGTNAFKKEMFIGLAEMQAVVLLCRAPKCWTATHALLMCRKTWRQVERGELGAPFLPECAKDVHTASGRKRGAKLSDFWHEGHALHPRGKTHYLEPAGPYPFDGVHGDDESLK